MDHRDPDDDVDRGHLAAREEYLYAEESSTIYYESGIDQIKTVASRARKGQDAELRRDVARGGGLGVRHDVVDHREEDHEPRVVSQAAVQKFRGGFLSSMPIGGRPTPAKEELHES